MIDYTRQILESTRYVAQHADHVHIAHKKIPALCAKLPLDKSTTSWLQETPFPIAELDDKDKTHLMLAFNSLSFSYWGDPYWEVTYKGTTYQRGSWSLLASLFRAKDEGFDILNPCVQANITRSDLEHILRGNREIPLLDKRVAIIRQVGGLVKKYYDNDFRNMIANARGDALHLLSFVIEQLPLFEDTAQYKGNAVSFYKRAQALVESVSSLQVQPLANVEKLTALADYIIPRKLREEGILVYSDALARKIDNKVPLLARGVYDVELRGCTITVIDEARKYLSMSPQQVNDCLWLIGRTSVTSEYQRVRTTDY